MFVFHVPGIGNVRVQATSQAEARLKLAQLVPQQFPNVSSDAITNATFVRVDDGSSQNQGIILGGSEGEFGFDPTVTRASGPGEDLSFDVLRDQPELARGAFNNALRSISPSLDPNGVLAGSLQGQFTPTALIASIGSLLGEVPETGDAPGAVQSGFRDIIQGGRQGEQLQNLFNRIGQTEAGALGSSLRNPEITTTTAESNDAQRLQELARQAAISKFGGLAASLLPSQRRANQGFDDQLAAAGGINPPSYFDYVRRTFGI